jgi:hypothetical protein
MKKLQLIFLAICALIFTSCSIFGTDSHSVHSKIVGRWQWIRSEGGLFPKVITPDCTGVPERHLIFKADHTYLSFQTDSLVQKGKYTLKKEDEKTIISYKISKKYLSPDQPADQYVKFNQYARFKTNDTLILVPSCADCSTHTYKRIH